jgi:hypothetical protein
VTGVGSDPRDLAQFIVETRKRLTSLERSTRNGTTVNMAGLEVGDGLQMTGFGTEASPAIVSVSARLGSQGQQVADWNDARTAGFYWSLSGALNAPFAERFAGEVRYVDTRIVQDVTAPYSDLSLTRAWRRVWSGTSWSAWYAVTNARTITDWNLATESGFYQGTGALNAPTALPDGTALGTWFEGATYLHDGGGSPRYSQELREANTVRQNVLWRRYYNGSTWSAWVPNGWSAELDLTPYVVSPFSVLTLFIGRRVDNVVEITGGFSGTLPSTTSVTEAASAIPTWLRPVANVNRWGTAFAAGYSGGMVVRPVGTIALTNRTGASMPNPQFSITYTL